VQASAPCRAHLQQWTKACRRQGIFPHCRGIFPRNISALPLAVQKYSVKTTLALYEREKDLKPHQEGKRILIRKFNRGQGKDSLSRETDFMLE